MANIIDTASSAGGFTKLLGAIDKAGLTDTLKAATNGPYTYTVFAPNDSAFDNVDIDSLSADALKETLLFHVVEGQKNPTRNGQSFQTLADGKEIACKVTVDTTDSFMWGAQEVGARVVNGPRNSISCDNGIIHVIDQVLIPYEGTVAPTRN